MSVICARNVGKVYRKYSQEWQRFANWFGLAIEPAGEQWVVRNVSFEVKQGESLGIIGQNGAGKSTLLKIISGVVIPTEGSISVTGRISAILELGMGFNPELTGRQNVFHAAGLMGFSYEQTQKKMPKIESFAEIGSFFDEPIRTYSSGMQVRVAFAVATAWQPSVLIIDEALSVGDGYFQHKSFSRIEELKRQGTTLCFVSHDSAAVKKLCEKVVVLDQSGEVAFQGGAEMAVDFYNTMINAKKGALITPEEDRIVSGNDHVEIVSVELHDEVEQTVKTLYTQEHYRLRVAVKIKADICKLTFGYLLKNKLDLDVFGTNTYYTDQVVTDLVAGEGLIFDVAFQASLGPGSYSVSLAFVETDGVVLYENYKWIERALIFEVANRDKDHFIGTNYITNEITIQCTDRGKITQ